MQKKLIRTELGALQDAEQSYQDAYGRKRTLQSKFQDLRDEVGAAVKEANRSVVNYNAVEKQLKNLGMSTKEISGGMKAANALLKEYQAISKKIMTLGK
jgi:predicted nuclease with TOPRIM domain